MDLRTENEIRDELTMLAGPLRWNIALTQPSQDATAYQALRLRGYTVYRPLMPENGRMSHGYPSKRQKSMFTGYLFVLPANTRRRTDVGPWEMLRTAPGMIYGDRALLKLNGCAATIAHNDPVHGGIVQIRETEERLCNITTNCESLQAHKIGDRVRVKKGPFIEMLGIIEALDDSARIALLVEGVQRTIRVYVNSAHIISAEA
jgi:hypothetical protein